METPVPAFSLYHLRNQSRLIGGTHAARQLTWRPTYCWPGIASIVEVYLAAGAVGVSCGLLREAEAAVAAGAGSVAIAFPPVVGSGPERLASLARRAEVTVIVDHFAQAERLSEACRAAGSRTDLLLRVDVGRHRLGVRPGPDLHDLAQGAASLSGVRLAGLAVETDADGPSGVSRLTNRELARLLDRCRASLARAGCEAGVVSVSRLDDGATGQLANPAITESRTPVRITPEGPFAIVAGVVGRPTRDQAVIDAGRSLLGDAATVVWPPGTGARFAVLEDDFAVLRLAESGRDLSIGDAVTVVPERPPRPSFGQPLLVGDGQDWQNVTAGSAHVAAPPS